MWFIHYNILYSLYFLCQPIRKIYFIHIHFIKLVKHSRMLSNQIHVHYFGIRWMKIHCRFRCFCCLFIWNVFIRIHLSLYLSVYEDGENIFKWLIWFNHSGMRNYKIWSTVFSFAPFAAELYSRYLNTSSLNQANKHWLTFRLLWYLLL